MNLNPLVKHGIIDFFLLATILGCAASNITDKPAERVVIAPKQETSIVTLDKIADGYEVAIMLLDQEQVDLLLPVTVEEIAKKLFLRQERGKFAPENVIIVPTSDPATEAYVKQFIYKSKGIFTSAELIDKEDVVLRCGSKDTTKDLYFRVMLVRPTTPKLQKSAEKEAY